MNEVEIRHWKCGACGCEYGTQNEAFLCCIETPEGEELLKIYYKCNGVKGK